MDPIDGDAHDQLEALRSGVVSAVELLDLAVGRAAADAKRVNAVVARRLDAARAEASAIDAARAHGEPLGRLAGLPMTVKDTFDIADLPASAGIPELLARDAIDAEVVRRVRAEGAIVWGHTNAPAGSTDWQSYNRLYGVTNNPWNASLTPGGSSGGSAAALASGVSALEIGADLGGSLRIPASFCGVYAHKPTFGVLSQAGIVPPSELEYDLAVVGPMARTTRDLHLLQAILGGTPAEAPASPRSLTGLRIGLWLDEPGFTLDPEVRGAIDRFARRLEAEGVAVDVVRPPVSGRETLDIYTILSWSLAWAKAPAAEHALYEALRGPAKIARALGAGPLSWAGGVLGASARHREWLAASEARARTRGSIADFLRGYDAVLAPIAPVTAFPHDHTPLATRRLRTSDGRSISYMQLLSWCALPTVWGLPATAIPAGRTARGLPVGVQLIGPAHADSRCIALARAIEARLGGFEPPPR